MSRPLCSTRAGTVPPGWQGLPSLQPFRGQSAAAGIAGAARKRSIFRAGFPVGGVCVFEPATFDDVQIRFLSVIGTVQSVPSCLGPVLRNLMYFKRLCLSGQIRQIIGSNRNSCIENGGFRLGILLDEQHLLLSRTCPTCPKQHNSQSTGRLRRTDDFRLTVFRTDSVPKTFSSRLNVNPPPHW